MLHSTIATQRFVRTVYPPCLPIFKNCSYIFPIRVSPLRNFEPPVNSDNSYSNISLLKGDNLSIPTFFAVQPLAIFSLGFISIYSCKGAFFHSIFLICFTAPMNLHLTRNHIHSSSRYHPRYKQV